MMLQKVQILTITIVVHTNLYSFRFTEEVVWNEYKMTGAVSKDQLTFGYTTVV